MVSPSIVEWKFVPLTCCYFGDCGGLTFKFVKRSSEEIEEMKDSQRICSENDALKRAASILAKRGPNSKMIEIGASLLDEHREEPYTSSHIMASTIFMEMLSKVDS